MGALDVAASSSFLYIIRFISSCFFREGPKQDYSWGCRVSEVGIDQG